MNLQEKTIKDLLKCNNKGVPFHRESLTLEFKEQFHLASLAEYFKDFAAFANNKGGFLVFGVKDLPNRSLIGLSDESLKRFENIDEARITKFLNDAFSPSIVWERTIFEARGKKFGVFHIEQSRQKPVIAKKNTGGQELSRDKKIYEGEIYYRYGGRTQKIGYTELQNIINEKAEDINKQWQNLTARIGKVGPGNAAILDSERGLISKGQKTHLIIDQELAKKIKFIREGEFDEKAGATTLKLVGDVKAAGSVEVTKILEKQLIDKYPYSYSKLEKKIKGLRTNVKAYQIQKIIKENDIKGDKRYSDYNFRTKEHKDLYEKTGKLPNSANSIYNEDAVKFILRIIDTSK